MPAAALTAPFAAAVARLGGKSPVAAALTSAEWAEVPLALRERAFFSARVANAETIARLKGALESALKLEGDTFMDKAKFVAEMRRELGAPEGDTGELTDLASRRRLELIYSQNIESAREYGRWKSGQAPELRDAFPAQEFLRVESRDEPREWGQRWADEGGQFYAGQRMIALKGDPIWTKLSRFGTPWPPFDFGSGMGVEDVSREEAEALGVIAPGAAAPAAEGEPADDMSLPDLTPFNATLSAAAPEDETLRKALQASLGDKWTIREGRIEAVKPTRGWVELGLPSAKTWANLPSAPQELTATAALAKMRAGHTVNDYAGQPVKFDQGTLDHWAGKKDVDERAARLPWAEATVADPLEVWEDATQQLYIAAFKKAGGAGKGCAVARTADGTVHTYYVNDIRSLDKMRKGLALLRRKESSK